MQTTHLSPAAERNKQPILEKLLQVLPATGKALEVASGTGQHAGWFAAGLPGWSWQPSEADSQAVAELAATLKQAHRPNLLAPVLLDVQQSPWCIAPANFDLVYCANMLHIAPWSCCAGLMRGTEQCLSASGALLTYGPYIEQDVATSESNLAFDQSLRQRNPQWGIRRLDDVAQQAALCGLALAERHAMPANNLLLVWRKA